VRPEPTVRQRLGGRSPVLPAEPAVLSRAHRVERVVAQVRRLARSRPPERQGEWVSAVSVVRRRVSLGEQRLLLLAAVRRGARERRQVPMLRAKQPPVLQPARRVLLGRRLQPVEPIPQA